MSMPERCGAQMPDVGIEVYCQLDKGHTSTYHFWTHPSGYHGQNWPVEQPEPADGDDATDVKPG